MKKILLVSGCSYTDPNWISDFHDIGPKAWQFWPDILAKKLDMEVINLAKMGAGNEYIYSSLLDKIITTDNIGLIMAAWSQCQRKDWKRNKKWMNNSAYMDIKIHNDMYAHVDKTLRYYYSLQEICKAKKIPYKACQMIHMFRGYSWDIATQRHKEDFELRKELLNHIHNSPYFDKIDDSFIGWPGDPDLGGFSMKSDLLKGYGKDSLPWAVSERDNHPNALGQEKIAKCLYSTLYSEGWV